MKNFLPKYIGDLYFSQAIFLYLFPRPRSYNSCHHFGKGGHADLMPFPSRRHPNQQIYVTTGLNHAFCGSGWRQKNRQAFSSAPELADNGEYDNYNLASMASSHVEKGPQGAEEERRRLPYSTLWTMQLAREEQSHQEACEKYAQVFFPPGMTSAHVLHGRENKRRGKHSLDLTSLSPPSSPSMCAHCP